MMSCMKRRTSSPSSTNKHASRSNRGSVAFDQRVYLIPSFLDTDEYGQVYFNAADELRNSADIVQCVATMCTGTDADRRSDEYCPRGLEKMRSSEHMARSAAAKARVINSVLDEQEEQWEDLSFDADRLAESSARHSTNAVEIALLLAESDVTFARIYNPTIPRPRSSRTKKKFLPSPSISLLLQGQVPPPKKMSLPGDASKIL